MKKIYLSELMTGIKEELEHKDVTGGNLYTTAKIAIAHLKEDERYYTKLRKAGIINPRKLTDHFTTSKGFKPYKWPFPVAYNLIHIPTNAIVVETLSSVKMAKELANELEKIGDWNFTNRDNFSNNVNLKKFNELKQRYTPEFIGGRNTKEWIYTYLRHNPVTALRKIGLIKNPSEEIYPLFNIGNIQITWDKFLATGLPFRDCGEISQEIMRKLKSLERKGDIVKYLDFTFPKPGKGYAIRNYKQSIEKQQIMESLRSLKNGCWVNAPEAQQRVKKRILSGDIKQPKIITPKKLRKAGLINNPISKDRCIGGLSGKCRRKPVWINKYGVLACDNHKMLIAAFTYESGGETAWKRIDKENPATAKMYRLKGEKKLSCRICGKIINDMYTIYDRGNVYHGRCFQKSRMKIK